MNIKLITLCAASLLVVPLIGDAQNYSIPWFKVAGGGAASTNSQFVLTGTIGQHDAGGPMTNGQYSVTGGFWVFPTAVQMPGAPLLKIAPAGPGQVTISWPPNTPGYRLQETATLAPANWTGSPSGAANPVTLPSTSAAKFYRLIK